MNKPALISATLVAASLLSVPALAGDPVVGKQKATACIACHGSESFGGIFYTLQLGGRDADKLTVKTMKYKTGKAFHPMMNIATAFFTEKEIEDVAAYYKSLGKPALTSPLFTIKGDDEVKTMEAVAVVPAMPAPAAMPVYAPSYAPSAYAPAAPSVAAVPAAPAAYPAYGKW